MTTQHTNWIYEHACWTDTTYTVENHLLMNKQSGMIDDTEYQQGLRELRTLREGLGQSTVSLKGLINPRYDSLNRV